MRRRPGAYDPAMLEAFAAIVGSGSRAVRICDIALSDLRTGMTLAADVCAVAGRLLIARGCPLETEVLARLRNLPAGYVREPIRIVEEVPAARGGPRRATRR